MRTIAFVTVVFLGACATVTPPRPVALDPSNPAAGESAAPGAAPSAPASSSASPAPGTHSCPMHPDVSGAQGTNCPKCGMALEPKRGATGDAPQAGGEHKY